MRRNNRSNNVRWRVVLGIFAFYGLLLLFFGNEIESFTKGLNTVQEIGLITLGAVFLVYGGLLLWKMQFFTGFIVIATIAWDGFHWYKGKLSVDDMTVLLNMFFITFVTWNFVNYIVPKVESWLSAVDKPSEKLTIAVAFIGVIISLMAILKN